MYDWTLPRNTKITKPVQHLVILAVAYDIPIR